VLGSRVLPDRYPQRVKSRQGQAASRLDGSGLHFILDAGGESSGRFLILSPIEENCGQSNIGYSEQRTDADMHINHSSPLASASLELLSRNR
jgi:hypothetical protein